MRRHLVIGLLVTGLLVVALPLRLSAWGFDVHRFIVGEAIDRLPPEMRGFYQTHRTFLIEYSVMPDLMRSLDVAEEPPRHFLDIDAYGAYPFRELPRDYEAAVRKFGSETIVKNGLLPWRTAEIYDRLVRAFERVGRGERYGLDDAKLMSAVLAHYVGDAFVPLHAIVNYDGQLTDQRGIHSRFESELFERFRPRLKLSRPALPEVVNPRDFIFDTLLEGTVASGPILEADRRAAAGRDTYDDVYFERFFGEARPILERRLAEAIAATAALIARAWEQGDRPDLSRVPGRSPRKVGGR